MKILLFNLPSGPVPTDYPPVGISRVIEGLDPALECEAEFLNLDLLRPSFTEIRSKCLDFSPQVIGFSAILTPTYKYLRELSLFLRKEFPGTVQVLGGEMGVIHKTVLRNSAVDFCVTGQAEPAFSLLLAELRRRDYSAADKAPFRGIKGLAFLDGNAAALTGEQEQGSTAVRQINYDLLSRFTDISHYIHGVSGRYYRDRIHPGEIGGFFGLLRPENLEKNMATVFSSKGCVGRCTFCHRHFKGYKSLPPETVAGYVAALKAKYNVGMVLFQVEDFGSDAAATKKLVNLLAGLGINWSAPAVRAKTVDAETLAAWKAAGCVNVNFGIESGSQKMLDVMEKLTLVEDNLEALLLCGRHRIATIISLLIGMPGETLETIEETISDLSTAIPEDPGLPYEISINFYQAVPGTEGYRFARNTGLIGPSDADEEKYIESLHESAANEISHYLNFTDYEKEEVLYWKNYILLELFSAYLARHGVLNVWRRKKLNRYYYAAAYRLLPRPLRRSLLKYLTVLKYYGPGGLLSLLRRKALNRKPAFYAKVNRSLRLINLDIAEGKPWT